MFTVYKKIKQLYRDQSGYTPNRNTFCIAQNQLELCGSEILELYDEEEDKSLHISKAAVTSASVKVTKVKSEWVFKNEIIRF